MNSQAVYLYNSKFDKAIGIKYDFCPYALGQTCMNTKEISNCILATCIHDMPTIQRNRFINFWQQAKQWLDLNTEGR